MRVIASGHRVCIRVYRALGVALFWGVRGLNQIVSTAISRLKLQAIRGLEFRAQGSEHLKKVIHKCQITGDLVSKDHRLLGKEYAWDE